MFIFLWGCWHGKQEAHGPDWRTAFVAGWREYLTLSGRAWICSEARNQRSWQALTQVLTPLSCLLMWLWAGVLLSHMGCHSPAITNQNLLIRQSRVYRVSESGRMPPHKALTVLCCGGVKESVENFVKKYSEVRCWLSVCRVTVGSFSSLSSNGPSPLCVL